MSDIRPVNVVFLLPRLSSGGAERVAITFLNHLNPARFQKKLAVVCNQGEMGAWLDPAIAMDDLNAGSVKSGLWPLLKYLRREKPDLVFSTMAHMNFAVLLLRPFLSRRTRIIVREANLPSSIIEGVRLSLLVRWAYKILYPFADGIVSPSIKIVEEFRDRLNINIRKHDVVFNPVDVDRILSAVGTVFPSPADASLRFVAAGRLHRQKGFDRLIAGLAEFSKDRPWTLTIYGEGDERASLENLISELKLKDRVFLPGLTSNPWRPIADSDVFLLPSRWEGLPNVVLESLTVGTPVIAMAEAGGIGEIADRATGAVKIAHSIDAFIGMMADARKKQENEFGRNLLPKEFFLDYAVARLEQIFIRLLASR